VGYEPEVQQLAKQDAVNMDIPRNGIPRDVSEIEDEIFWFVVFGPPQYLCPVFQIGPGFLRRTSTERWETG
jgi:hypothetical protein